MIWAVPFLTGIELSVVPLGKVITQPNINDKCPNEAGSKEFGGCPKLPGSLSSFLNNYSEFFFDFDSYEIDDTQRINITNLSKILMKYEYIKINIDGHASSEGESDYNMLLSNRRSINNEYLKPLFCNF